MKVIVATDGSKYGRWALEWIAQLPLARRPDVKVLHIVDIGALRAPFVAQAVVAGTERYLKAEIARVEAHGRKTKQDAMSMLKSLHLKGKAVVERGPVAATIIKAAGRGVHLVAVGSRGLDGLDRFMLGSVSTHAVHHVTCSILVVKEAPRSIRHVILAIDGSSASKKAVRFLLQSMRPCADMPDQKPITVTVTHVMRVAKSPDVLEAGKVLVQQCANGLEQAGYLVEERTRIGHPANEILNVAHDRKAELIVTGARGLGAIGRLFLGSVSSRIVQHANCSVLVVR